MLDWCFQMVWRCSRWSYCRSRICVSGSLQVPCIRGYSMIVRNPSFTQVWSRISRSILESSPSHHHVYRILIKVIELVGVARTPENTVRGLMGKRQNLGQNLLEVRWKGQNLRVFWRGGPVWERAKKWPSNQRSDGKGKIYPCQRLCGSVVTQPTHVLPEA